MPDPDVSTVQKWAELEYGALRKEIEVRVHQRHQFYVIATTGSAAFFALVGKTGVDATILFLFPAFTVFLAWAWSQNETRIRQLGAYILTRIEVPFAASKAVPGATYRHPGWELYLCSEEPKSLFGRQPTVVIAGGGVFVVPQIFSLLWGVRSNWAAFQKGPDVYDLHSWLPLTAGMVGLAGTLWVISRYALKRHGDALCGNPQSHILRNLVESQLESQLKDRELAVCLAEMTEAGILTWQAPTNSQDQPNVIVALSFGYRHSITEPAVVPETTALRPQCGAIVSAAPTETSPREPGTVNEALAEVTLDEIRRSPGALVFVQEEIGDAITKKANEANLSITNVRKIGPEQGKYLSTRGVLEKVKVSIGDPALQRVLLIAHRDHAERCTRVAREVGFVHCFTLCRFRPEWEPVFRR